MVEIRDYMNYDKSGKGKILLLVIFACWFVVHGSFFLTSPIYKPNDSNAYLLIADILEGKTPFFAQVFYYPPGYSFVIMLVDVLFGERPYSLVILQHISILLTAFMLLDFGKQLGNIRIGFISGLFVVFSPLLLHWSHLLYTEILTSFLLVLALWSTLKAVSNTAYTKYWVILASLSLAWGGLARTTPYVLSIPVTIFLIHSHRKGREARGIILFFLPIILCVVVYCCWSSYNFVKTGDFTHTQGPGRHIYNRVVHCDKTLARDRPHTRRLLGILSENEALQPHWEVYRLLTLEKGLKPKEATDLMANVSKESILERPFKYVFHTARLLFQYWFIEPERLTGDIIRNIILPGPASLVKRLTTLFVYLTGHGFVGGLAILGAVYCFVSRSSFLILIFSFLFIYLLIHAAAEWSSMRFGIPGYPLLAFLGAWGMWYGGRCLISRPNR